MCKIHSDWECYRAKQLLEALLSTDNLSDHDIKEMKELAARIKNYKDDKQAKKNPVN